jgi:DNA repair protein RecO (recombination protein O)
MSQIVKTDAIVLKSMKYGDTSKIVTFYTKEFGKIKGIVKGARSKKNKFGSTLETFSSVQLVMYKKDDRNLHLISQCDLMKSHKSLTDNLEKLTVSLRIVELSDKIFHDEERNPAVFELIAEALNAINDQNKNIDNVFYSLEIKLLELLGYRINFKSCGICDKSVGDTEVFETEMVFDFSVGSPLCRKDKNSGNYLVNLSLQNCKILDRFESTKALSAVCNVVLSPVSSNQIRKFLFNYLRYHICELKELKSENIFNQIN